MPPEVLSPERPQHPETFRSGDLLWPRADSQVVLKNVGMPDPSEALWEQQRDEFIARIASNPEAPEEDKALVERIANWTYEDYVSFPEEGDLEAKGLPGGKKFYVGHIAIVQVRDGVPWVIDASTKRNYNDGTSGPGGVGEQTYARWLDDHARDGSHVWHARLPALTDTQREGAARVALEQVGKPYKFFRFGLDDTSGFYCSKLVWYAFSKAAGVRLDDKDANRRFWFSPLQAMRSPHIEMLFKPGVPYSPVL